MAKLLWKSKKNKRQKSIVVAVSGGFDPIHVGHVRLFQEAKKLGDRLIIILNNNNWLRAKKDTFLCQKKSGKKFWRHSEMSIK